MHLLKSKKCGSNFRLIAALRAFQVMLFGLLAVTLLQAQTYNWKNVAIKGGGFVTGIITHPGARGLIYCRTDIGGAYRWNPTNDSWIPLLDYADSANLFGVESLAIDPSDTNRLYIATSRGWPEVLLISTNQGATFASFNPPFDLDGNVDGRSNGERMAVDPNSNNILIYGSRLNGLYKSTNYGTNWSPVATFPVTSTPNNVGLVLVEFIKNSGSPGSATPVIFVGVSRTNFNSNLFMTTNGGVTWASVATGAPAGQMPHRAAQDGLGNIYITFCDNAGPNSISTGSVIKLNLATLAPTDVTPAKPAGAQGGFAGVSVDPQNPTTVIVSTIDRWWAPSPLPPWDTIYRSVNGGASWIVAGPASQPSATSAPWSVSRNPHWAGDLKFDPFNSNRCFFVTGYGVIATTNLTAGSVNWRFYNDGIEETVPLGLASPPSGPNLLSAHGDIGGFRHFNLDVSPPLADYFNTHRSTSLGIDFTESNPNFIARLFSDSPYGCFSANGGTTWSDFPTFPAAAANGVGNLAVSASGSRIVWMPQGAGAYHSTNNGSTWIASTGSPIGNGRVISDRVNSNKFYIYSTTGTDQIHVSTDGGVNFTPGAAIASGQNPRAVFGQEGHIWLPRGNSGLSRSINSGASFTTVSGVLQANFVSFGMAATGQTYPAIFIVGRANGASALGIYRSDNAGASWVRINDNQHQFGLATVHDFCADPRVFGRVYFGTEGRGIIYGQPSNQPPGPIVDLAAVGGNQQVALTWSAVSGADSYIVKRSLVSGSSFVTIASGVTANSFIDTGLANGVTYYYVVAGTNAFGAGPDSNEASATPREVQALYAFEGNAQDSSGSGNHGTATALGYVTGKVGSQGAQFNGTSSYVLIPRSITDDFTVAMWVRTTDTAGTAGAQWWNGKGLVDGEVGGGGADWGTAIVNGKFVLGVGSTGGDTTIASSVNINDGTWHHVAATRNNTSGAMAVYVDGVLRGSGTGPTGSRTFPTSLRIGSLQTGNNFLNGTLDDVRLYDRILTVSEINALIATPPAAPTSLAAIAGDANVALSWSASATATSYYIKRSTTSGTGYVNIATNASPGFTNTGLANGTLYYFVVSGVNAGGEGTNSLEVSARSTSSAPVQLGLTAAGNLLQLTWPFDHTGWVLQSQTNTLATGLGANWVTISSSAQTNQVSFPVNPANGAVFFRLVLP